MLVRVTLLVLASLFVHGQAFAIDTGNKENVDLFTKIAFADGAKPNDHFIQTGKSTSGAECKLTVLLTRYGISYSLNEAPNRYAYFRVSVSSKTSSKFEILDSDENAIEAKQIALSMDERGTYVDKEYIKLLDRESPGTENNIAEITIRSTLNEDGKEVSSSEITCNFGP